MTAEDSLRDVLISSSRTHAVMDLNRLNQVGHARKLAIAATGLLLASLLLPRRIRFVATVLLTSVGAWAARDWLRQEVAAYWNSRRTGPCTEPPCPETCDKPMSGSDASLIDLLSQQSFPASDAPGNV